MVNYNNSYIYKLCCKDTDITDIYIGSTTNFINRKCQHKCCCNSINRKGYNIKVYQFIREHGGWENWTMILIEKVNVNCKLELHKIERKYIEELQPSLNKALPLRTCKESRKQYYENNKDFYKQYNKEYRENNKEKLNKDKKEYYQNNKEAIKECLKLKIICECGSVVRKDAISRHIKTKKHIKFLGRPSVALELSGSCP